MSPPVYNGQDKSGSLLREEECLVPNAHLALHNLSLTAKSSVIEEERKPVPWGGQHEIILLLLAFP